MNSPTITNRQLIELVKTYWQWRWVWASTTAAFALLGLFYVLFLKSDVWVASQGMIVRDEANGAVMRLGRFQSQTEMKAAQETVLEMARNPQVLNNALAEVGREPTWFGFAQNTEPPTPSEIENLATSGIEVRAPRGAEFGTTEVIYLDVKDTSRQRALKLNNAVCEALEDQLQSVRQNRAAGVVAELTTARDGAILALRSATDRLQAIEAEVGADLSDLRGLTDVNTGGNANRTVLDAIKVEMRQVELQRHQLEIDSNLAKESFENPDHLLLTPSRLVTNHAGLKKLREGLADAKIQTAQLEGRFTDKNPIVIAAIETEDRIRQQLRQELGTAMQSLAKDVEVADKQLAKLKSQQSQLESRLERLADIRAVYANVASEVRARNEELQEAERELGQALASRDAAFTSSLLTRVDKAVIGEKPIGPGRSTILAGTVFGGLFFGLGIVFLLTPLDSQLNFGRRRFDYSGGRGRRNEDTSAATPNVSGVPTALNLNEPGEGTETSGQETRWSEVSASVPESAQATSAQHDKPTAESARQESPVAELQVETNAEENPTNESLAETQQPKVESIEPSSDNSAGTIEDKPADVIGIHHHDVAETSEELEVISQPAPLSQPVAPQAPQSAEVSVSTEEAVPVDEPSASKPKAETETETETETATPAEASSSTEEEVDSEAELSEEAEKKAASHETAQAIIMQALNYSSGVSISTPSVR